MTSGGPKVCQNVARAEISVSVEGSNDLDHKEIWCVMQGVFVLTIVPFIARVLGAPYRIPFQNLVGDEGFYVYQQVYPIYEITTTLALSGLPQSTSEHVTERKNPFERK